MLTGGCVRAPAAVLTGVLYVLVVACWLAHGSSFASDFDVNWGGGRGKILNNGQLLSLSLDRGSGSGFRSKTQYLYGRIDTQIKLVPGNSAGTVTTYYLSSLGGAHDEIDLEFLGNSSGNPYVLHTNVFAKGLGNREQQFYLWFDPTKDFHTYSILWNPQTIIFYVDGTPIRQFKNLESRGVPFPKSQPMWIYGSLWDAEDWATQGGRVKTDWSKAPFVASYRNVALQGCAWPAKSSCPIGSPWMSQSALDAAGLQRMKSVQKTCMIYDYCTDVHRFPQGLPLECSIN
ncbi:hypothetical protein V2J09_017952 [Rumex salicifolius]